MSDYCKCGTPWLAADSCEKCGRKVSPERISLLEKSNNSIEPAKEKSTNSTLQKSIDPGKDAAERVTRYGTLFEKIGSVLQVLNTVGAILLVIFLLVAQPSGAYFFLGLLVIGLIWCISYLQTSFIRGLASYFQMRSADYLERRSK
jgi:hypothetical protein